MRAFREIIRQYRGIAWLLSTALVLHLICQLQFHLHHGDNDFGEEDHLIDYHIVTDTHPVGHPSHEDTHELKSTPDVILKKNISPESIYLPVAFLLLLISAIELRRSVSNIPHRNKLYRYQYYGLAPPTRAPPAI